MYGKGFLGNMTENLQADYVQSRQAGFIRCFLRAIPHKDCATDAKQDIFMITYNIKDVNILFVFLR